LPKDNRITTLGKFLRKFHIDEWPQFVNIIKGDISFVGPRPEEYELAQMFEKEVPFYTLRSIVTPGLTG
jgi:lipopolysaccharide/colanic/teichoic acid biosynthesis glycosyltransferase